MAKTETELAIENRLANLDSLKGKMPDNLYQKYRERIRSSRSYSEVVDSYKQALEEWSSSGENNPQAPNAQQIQVVKDNQARQLRALGVPDRIVADFKKKMAKELTLDNTLKYYDEAINEWSDNLTLPAASNSQQSRDSVSASFQSKANPDILKVLSGGNTSFTIQQDIDKLKTKRQNMPAKEAGLVDELIGGLEQLKNITPEQAGLGPLKAIGDLYTKLNKKGDDVAESVRKAIGEEILSPLKAIGNAYSSLESKGNSIASQARTGIKEDIVNPFLAVGKAYKTVDESITNGVKNAGLPSTAYPNTPPPNYKLSDVTGFIDGLGNMASNAGKSASEAIRNAASEFYDWAEKRGNDLLGKEPGSKKISLDDIKNSMMGIISGGSSTPAKPGMSISERRAGRNADIAGSSPTTTIAERRAGRRSSTGNSPDTDNVVAGPSESVKAVQGYLNSFFYEKALQQKGYSRGADGKVYDETGKEVNVDKITDTAKNERINEDGRFGKETEAALKIYNLANPKSQIKFDETESGLKTLSDKKSVQQIQDFYNNGSIPRYGVQKVDPLKIKQMVGQKAPEKLTVPVGDVVSPIKQEASTGRMGGALSSALNPENLQRIGGNLADTLSVANLLRESSQPLPTYQQTPDWIDYTNRIANRANQGLTSAVQSEFNRNMNTNRASGYSQIMAAAGGGGSQGAVLGALGQVNQNSADAIGKYALADQAQRDVNLQAYGNVARAEEATNQSMFGMEYQAASQRQSQAASMIPSIMSQIGQRNQTYNAYGPGSVYEKFTNAQIQEAEYNAELAKSMNSNVGNLFGTSTTPFAKVSDRDNGLISGTEVNTLPTPANVSPDRVKRLIQISQTSPSSISENDKQLLKKFGIMFSN
jgi:hypothetical protein